MNTQIQPEMDYAEMLEIPVSTVNVVKKRSLFSKKNKRAEEVKEEVLSAVNNRFEARTEYSEKVVKERRKFTKSGIVLVTETVLCCALAVGIFVSNLVIENTAINTFLHGFQVGAVAEKMYSELTLSPVVSATSNAECIVTGGAITFTEEGAIYPVHEGKVTSTRKGENGYTVEVAHTSSFVSVMQGLSNLYYNEGDTVKGNLPIAYSDGTKEVKISLYNDGELLSCYTLSGAQPIWTT